MSQVKTSQIDVLILTEKGLAILDLKSYQGKIIGSENGEWLVINNKETKKLHENLFRQLGRQKFALLEKLNPIRDKYFKHIEREKLGRIRCWGYFEKGSTYNIEQVGRGAHLWFDIITADNLIEKLESIDAYPLRAKEMDSIVKGLNLMEYPFEKYAPKMVQTSESHADTEDLSIPQKKEDIFENVKPQMVHGLDAADADERMFDGVLYHLHSGYDWHLPSEKHDDTEERMHNVLEHKHPSHDYWHPASRVHKFE